MLIYVQLSLKINLSNFNEICGVIMKVVRRSNLQCNSPLNCIESIAKHKLFNYVAIKTVYQSVGNYFVLQHLCGL